MHKSKFDYFQSRATAIRQWFDENNSKTWKMKLIWFQTSIRLFQMFPLLSPRLVRTSAKHSTDGEVCYSHQNIRKTFNSKFKVIARPNRKKMKPNNRNLHRLFDIAIPVHWWWGTKQIWFFDGWILNRDRESLFEQLAIQFSWYLYCIRL